MSQIDDKIKNNTATSLGFSNNKPSGADNIENPTPSISKELAVRIIARKLEAKHSADAYNRKQEELQRNAEILREVQNAERQARIYHAASLRTFPSGYLFFSNKELDLTNMSVYSVIYKNLKENINFMLPIRTRVPKNSSRISDKYKVKLNPTLITSAFTEARAS